MLNGCHTYILCLNKHYFKLSHYSNSETTRKLISPCRSLLVWELHGLLGSLAGRLVSLMLLFLAGDVSRQMYRKLCYAVNHAGGTGIERDSAIKYAVRLCALYSQSVSCIKILKCWNLQEESWRCCSFPCYIIRSLITRTQQHLLSRWWN
jgi:hypothetical protein